MIVIHVLVVTTMLARPEQNGILESRRAKDQRPQTNGPCRLKCDVGKEPVIAQANAEPAGRDEREEKADVKPGQADFPDVERNDRQCEQQRAH